ncbi:hypothetical protein [Cellulomonas sp. URHB0016]
MIAQSRIIEAIARSLALVVEPGWTGIDYRRAVLSPVSEGHLHVVYPEREAYPPAPREVAKLVKQLRDVMYVERSGTWFTFELWIEAPGSVRSKFNYDDEPAWDAPVPAGAYVTDQHSYPRDVEHQPAWLRDKIAAGWARINDLAPGERPEWVRRRIDEGTHHLTAEGLVAKQ